MSKTPLTKEEEAAVYAAIDYVKDRNPKVDEVFRALDMAYNDGISHAIEVVEEYRKAGYTHHALGGIISKLQSLIKK